MLLEVYFYISLTFPVLSLDTSAFPNILPSFPSFCSLQTHIHPSIWVEEYGDFKINLTMS